jgi:hypothetical protein
MRVLTSKPSRMWSSAVGVAELVEVGEPGAELVGGEALPARDANRSTR